MNCAGNSTPSGSISMAHDDLQIKNRERLESPSPNTGRNFRRLSPIDVEVPSVLRRASVQGPACVRRRRRSLGVTALVAMFALGAGNASAQQTAVCSDTPGEGERIECIEASTSSTDIVLVPRGIDIDTIERDISGISGQHEGTGDITIDLGVGVVEENGSYRAVYSEVSTVGGDVTEGKAHAIYARHKGVGDIDIDVFGTDLSTTGPHSHGIYAFIGHTDIETDDPPLAAGNIDIDVKQHVTIETEGSASHGVYARHSGGQAGWTLP